jgi:hypothetical protein
MQLPTALPAGVVLLLLQYPLYQPSPFEEPIITLQDGQFCPTSQPEWSAYRDPSFGHGKSSALSRCSVHLHTLPVPSRPKLQPALSPAGSS